MLVDIWILVFVLRASVEFLTQYLMALCFIASVQLHQNLTNYAVKLGRRNVCFIRIILCPN